MRLLCLDLGSSTGYCLSEDGIVIRSNYISLISPKVTSEQRAAGKDRHQDARIAALYKLVVAERPDIVYFEDVTFMTSQAQGQLWGSLRGAVWSACCALEIPCYGISVQTLKSFAGASGAAKGEAKEAMLAAMKEKHPEDYLRLRNKGANSDEIDACWLRFAAEAHQAGALDLVSSMAKKREAKKAKNAKKAALNRQLKWARSRVALGYDGLLSALVEKYGGELIVSKAEVKRLTN